MQWFREELSVTHHLHGFGFTGLTVTNPRIQFICVARSPNFAEVHRTRVPHILEILKDFFFCLFEKRNTKLLFVMTQKNKTQLNPIPQGTAQHRLGKRCLLWSSRCRPGSLVPWGLQGGTPSQGGPWQPQLLLLLFRIRHTAPFLPGSLVKCSLSPKHGATEKNKHDFCFLTRLCITAQHHTQMFPSVTHHSQERGSLTSLEEILKSCLF